MEDATLKDRIKAMMVENLMLRATAAEIGDDLPLFGPGGLGAGFGVTRCNCVVGLRQKFWREDSRPRGGEGKFCKA